MKEPRRRFIVVADDDNHHRSSVGSDLQALGDHVEVKLAKNATELFNHARFGSLSEPPDWTPADAITLDDNYGRDQHKWNIDSTLHREKVDTKLKEAGMDENQRRSVIGFSNSINLAIALRAVGYRGDIIVVSSGPPTSRMINRSSSELDIKKPVIDGSVVKKVMFGEILYVKYETDPKTGDISGDLRSKKGTRIDAFRELLEY